MISLSGQAPPRPADRGAAFGLAVDVAADRYSKMQVISLDLDVERP